MPGPLLASAIPELVTSGAALLGQGINAATQGSMNRQTRRWNEKMYQMQRNDALADWMRNNAYNTPEAQMQRFKQAGLNPNLIYKQTNEAAPVRSTDVKSWNPTPPQFDLGAIAQSALFAGVDLRQREANVQNTEEAVRLNQARIKETEARTAGLIEGTLKTSQQNKRYNEIVDSQLSVMKANVNRQLAETNQTITKTDQMKALFTTGLQQAVLEVEKTRLGNAKTQAERSLILQNIENAKKDGELKRLDIELKKMGIMPGDNLFMRILGRQLSNPKNQIWHKENKPNKVMDR